MPSASLGQPHVVVRTQEIVTRALVHQRDGALVRRRHHVEDLRADRRGLRHARGSSHCQARGSGAATLDVWNAMLWALPAFSVSYSFGQVRRGRCPSSRSLGLQRGRDTGGGHRALQIARHHQQQTVAAAILDRLASFMFPPDP
ncbi:MAG: hypothetical protein QM736_26015 [Vicinamibacterales bacterium]